MNPSYSIIPSFFRRSALAMAIASIAFQHLEAAANETPNSSSQNGAPAVVDSLNFSGGTLGEFATIIAENESYPFNLVVSEELAHLKLPAFTLRNVDGAVLASALTGLLQSQNAYVRIPVMTQDSNQTLVAMAMEFAPPNSSTRIECFDLVMLLDDFTSDQIADSIRAAWSLDSMLDPNSASLKFHPETKLLFVAGHSDTIMNIARDVVGTLRARVESQDESKRLEAMLRRRAEKKYAPEANEQDDGQPRQEP